MTNDKSAEEIVRGLRCEVTCNAGDCPAEECGPQCKYYADETYQIYELLSGAAAMIESLTAQLAASQQETRAAVEFIQHIDHEYSRYIADKGFERWRGPQEAKNRKKQPEFYNCPACRCVVSDLIDACPMCGCELDGHQEAGEKSR